LKNLQAIPRKFLPNLEDDDSREEEEKLIQLEEDRDGLIPKEHEAAARPTKAGDYWMEWVDRDDIHTRYPVFTYALNQLCTYMFMDCDKGTLVVLGFGLLLHEC
jgi:hypothetical protein